jgi:Tfp pilus assembly protein PilN
MLRGNLSTRPFYNERAVALGLVLFGVLVAAMTAINVGRLVALSSRHAELRARTETAARRTTELRTEASRARASVDAASLDRVTRATREANLLIDRRTFSWTDLFNRLEATLPPDIRVTAIYPSLNDGRFVIRFGVVARSVEQIDEFIEALEKNGGFSEVLAREERTNDEDQIEGTLEGIYLPGHDAASADPKRATR